MILWHADRKRPDNKSFIFEACFLMTIFVSIFLKCFSIAVHLVENHYLCFQMINTRIGLSCNYIAFPVDTFNYLLFCPEQHQISYLYLLGIILKLLQLFTKNWKEWHEKMLRMAWNEFVNLSTLLKLFKFLRPKRGWQLETMSILIIMRYQFFMTLSIK